MTCSYGGTLNLKEWQETRALSKRNFPKYFRIKEDEIYANLTELQQFGIVEEYFSDLHVLATRIKNIPSKQLLLIAIAGLKPNIMNKLKVLGVKDVEQVHRKVKLFKETHC